MTGELAIVRTQGTVLSILLALAISIAAALKGLVKNIEGAGLKGSAGEASVGPGCRSAGVMMGLLKQRR